MGGPADATRLGADPAISVCIPSAGRSSQLDRCLGSLQLQDRPPAFEVLVASSGNPETAAVVQLRFPAATVLVVGAVRPGATRNALFDRTRGDVLLFLDDDVVAGADLLRRVEGLARARPEVAVFGGPNETPPGSSRFQVVQGAVLASLVATGPVRYRYGRHRAGPADERSLILCNLAIRRTSMVAFDPDLTCAEENLVLDHLHRRGVPMRYDPDLVVFHDRRPTLASFASQMLNYGRGRGEVTVRQPRSLRPHFVAPAALVAYLGVLPFLLALRPALALPLVAYGLLVAAGGLRVASTLRSVRAAPLAAALIVVVHVCYGSGVIRGLAGFHRVPAPSPAKAV